MKLTNRTILLIALVFTAITLTSAAGAAHVAAYLDPLHTEVSNRLAVASTNVPRRDLAALRSAGRILQRNTKTLAGDVSLLGSAARTLNTRFASDAAFAQLETQAIADYSAMAHAQLDQAEGIIGTNSISRGTSNRLVRARAALNGADAATNSVPAHARALSSALTQINLAATMVYAVLTAPSSLAGRAVNLFEDAIVNEQTRYFLHGNDTYLADTDPEELGLWSYRRTGPKTGIITLDPDYPPGFVTPHDLALTFVTPTTGTFTGQNVNGENIRGNFWVE